MAKHIVTEFGIEVQFSEKVMAGLQKLERQTMQAATKIEKALNKAFNPSTQPFMQSLQRMERAANKSSQNIRKHLQNGLATQVNARNMFNGITQEADRVARQSRRTLEGISRGLGLPQPGSHGGNNRPPRQPRQTPFQHSPEMRMYNRFANSSRMQRLEASGGRNTLYAREMQSRAANAMVRFEGDTQNLRRVFAMLNEEVRQHAGAVRRDTAATRDHSQSEQRNERRERNSSRGGGLFGGRGRRGEREPKGGGMGMFGAMMASNAVTFAIQKGVEVAQEAFTQGKERQQSQTMMNSAYGVWGKDMTDRTAEYANKYGVDQTEAMKQMAILRNTLPAEKFTNMQVLEHMKNLTVFSHATGVSNEAQGRANYAISQIAGSSKINKQDVNQLTQAIPEALNITAKAMGIEKTKLIAELKDIKPDVFIANFEKGMKAFNERTGADAKAQQSIQAAQGRMTNAWNNDLIAGFEATGTSVGGWMDKLTSVLVSAQPVFVGIGKTFGWLSDNTSMMFDHLGKLNTAIHDLWNSLSPQSQNALRVVGKAIGGIVTALVNAPFKAFGWAIDKLIDLINKISGDDSTIQPGRSQKWGNGVEQGSYVEKGLDWLFGKEQAYERDKNSATPMLTGIMNSLNSVPVPQGQPDYGYNNSDYGLKAQQQQPLNVNQNMKVGVEMKPITFQPITLNIPMPDGTTHSEVVNLIADNSENQLVNTNVMGGGWDSQANNAGWKTNVSLAY
jgi:tape measure domain-containing protein